MENNASSETTTRTSMTVEGSVEPARRRTDGRQNQVTRPEHEEAMRHPNHITILTEVRRGDTARRWKATARAATIEPLMMNCEGEGEGAAPDVAAKRAAEQAVSGLLRAYNEA